MRGNIHRMWILSAAVIVGLMAFAGTVQAGESSDDAEIEVDWHKDGLGFTVNSSKDISNVIVEFCPIDDERRAHKHQGEFQGDDITEWTHRETEPIRQIWVKAGSNHDPEGPQPPAPFDQGGQSGEYFENPFVDCDAEDVCVGPQEIDARATIEPSNVVNWSSFEGADNYTLYRAVENGTHEELVTTEATHYNDTDVVPGTRYNYTVTATVNGIESERCAWVEITAIPDVATVLGGSVVVLAGVGSYAVYRRRG